MKNKKAKKKGQKKQRIAPEPMVEIQEIFSAPVKTLPLNKALVVAEQWQGRNECRVSESIYTQLIAQCPDRREPAILLLNSFIKRGEFDTARLQAYRIAVLFKEDAEVIQEVAKFFQQAGDTEKALDILYETLGLPKLNNRHMILRAIANIYLEEGQTQKAQDFFYEALSICDTDVSILFGLAKVDRKTSREDILGRLLTLEKNGLERPEQLPMLHFAAAYLYEGYDNEKYFHHLDIANRLFSLDHSSEIDRLHQQQEQRLRHATPAFFASFTRRQPEYPSPIFIVAPPRSGTTLVEQVLGAHPDTYAVGESLAFVAAINCIHAEEAKSDDIFSWLPEELEPCLSKIERHFFKHTRIPDEARGYTVVDKGVENIDCVGLIMLTWPDARIIRLKRHPLDTILSCYHQFFVNGRDTFFNLEALALYFVNYQKTMDYWQALFPDRVLTLEYEELVINQESATRNLLDFCGLPWNESCLDFHKSVSTVLTASNLQVRQPMYAKSIGRWKPFTKQLTPAIQILERDLQCSFEL